MNQKVAFITGITGQDGSHLTDLLLEKNYKVIGMVRRNSVPENQTYRINHVMNNSNLILEYGDLEDITSIIRILNTYQPNEIYHLGAQSHVGISFKTPIYTSNVVAIGTVNLLEAIRIACPDTKMYNAGSSEMFGNSIDSDGFQRETTPMHPVSPYGCAKTFAYNICRNYRNSYGLFISTGILFNHEGVRRGINFVTGKVARDAVRIKKGIIESLPMGNLNAARDWSSSKDFVKVMWEILQLNEADDFVCASGISHTVEDLLKYTFNLLDLDYKDYVTIEEKYLRPEELNVLKGDCSKLKKAIPHWKPEYTFESMMKEMVNHWMKYYE